jgi:putative transposase
VRSTATFVAHGPAISTVGAEHRNISLKIRLENYGHYNNIYQKTNQMANTYTQCYFQLVFAAKNRNALIDNAWKNDLEKYITGIIQNHSHKLLAIGSVPDHIHILIGYNVNHLIPDLVENIKTSSNAWIKQNRLSPFRFQWQIGYGAFTYSRSDIDNVANYIFNQEQHHKKENFKDEYLTLLQEFEIEFKDEYLFEFI